jgi:inward rectifier potassium channel
MLFLLAGFDGLKGLEHVSPQHDFMEAFFFSSQTLTTVGYGSVSPKGLSSNIIASFEALTGLLSFALISGLMYGRFARPRARVVFSENLLVSPYRDGKALMFRMVNARRSELIETEVQVIITINQLGDDGAMARKFYTLQLELNKISFFSLSWTIVHALTEDSPLFGFTQEDIINGNLEVLVLVKGTDEANHQIVYARRSYIAEDMVWNARFKPIISSTNKGIPNVMTRLIDSYESVG